MQVEHKNYSFHLPKEVLDIKSQEAVIKPGKFMGEMKIIGEDRQGSRLKRPRSE